MALLVLLAACSRQPSRPARPAPACHLRVMTYNVNFGIPGDGPTIDAIERGGADLVLLQETNAAWEHALRTRFRGLYPHIAFHHCCGAGGLAILSRHRFADGEILRPEGKGWFPAWRVELQSPIGRLQVMLVHLHPPLGENGGVVSGFFTSGAIREAEAARLIQALVPSIPALVAGDFNEEAGGGALRQFLEQGFVDVLQEMTPDSPTWRWKTSVGTLRRQFDHILHPRDIEVFSAEVLDAGRSDHLPVVATLGRAGATNCQ